MQTACMEHSFTEGRTSQKVAVRVLEYILLYVQVVDYGTVNK